MLAACMSATTMTKNMYSGVGGNVHLSVRVCMFARPGCAVIRAEGQQAKDMNFALATILLPTQLDVMFIYTYVVLWTFIFI